MNSHILSLTLTNQGPSDGTGIIVSDNLPAEVAFVAADGAYDDATGEWTVGDLTAGQTVSLNITVELLEFDDEIINIAEVSAADQPDIDSEPGNDDPTEDDQDDVVVGGVEIDLELTKVVSQDVVNVGDEVTWTITVQNQGPSTATGVVVGDALPAGLTVTGANAQVGSVDGTTWTVGTIPVGASYDLEITTTVDGVGPYVNIAQVIEADQPDIDSETGNDDGDQSEDDEDNAQVTGEQIDLELVKDASVETAFLGDQFTYTLDLSNEGPSDATGIVVQDDLPECVKYISSMATAGAYNQLNGEWTVGDLAADEIIELTITVEIIDECGSFINVAQVIAADQPDIDSDSNNDDGDQSEDDEDNAPVTIEELGSIGDYVWHDENADGIQDPNEVGIPNVTVTLTLPDGTEVTTTTDADGGYLFDDLPAGDYVVTVGDGPDNMGLTTGGTDDVTLGPGEDYEDADFGFDYASLGNYVWFDDNGDGIQDPSEEGIDGVVVNLLDSNGNLLETTTTADGGFYEFDELAPGDYIVEFVQPDNGEPTTQGGGDDQIDTDSNADPITGQTAVITLDAGENDPTIDAGYTPLGSIGDFVWLDENTDGIQDAGEPGVQGVEIILTNPDGTMDTTYTDGEGYYIFENLPAGDYTVAVGEGPANTELTTDGTDDVTLGPGEDYVDADFGFFSAGLGDYTWIDENANGIQDAGEAPVSGVVVNLYDATDLSTILATATTDANGYYQFIGLDPALDYVIEFQTPQGFTETTQSGDASAGGADDSDAGPGGFTDVIDLDAGEFDGTIDAGFVQLGSIGDFVWHDIDGDGIQDPNEPGISGVEITLTLPDGTTITTATDADGGYLFDELDPGTYTVTVGDGPDNMGLTTGDTDTVELGPGEQYEDADFGFDYASLGDYVWFDDNANGVQDADEQGVDGVVVNLLDGDGNFITSTTTDDGGFYLFDELAPGDYIVEFEAPVDGAPTTQGGGDDQNNTDSNADPVTGQTAIITLDAGEDDLTIDAGYTPLGSIGDYVWLDDNADGVQDPGEEGIAGVIVTLTFPDGTTETTTTDADGLYIFEGLEAGDYVVTVGSGPDGTVITTPDTDNVSLGAGEDYVDADFGFDPEEADLSITKTVDTNEAQVGDIVTYTIEVCNDGPYDATGVVVEELVPDNCICVGHINAYDPEIGQWDVGTVPAGECVEMDVEMEVTEGGLIVNCAEILEADQEDPDSTPANGVDFEDDHACAFVNGDALVDISLVKSVDVATAVQGDIVTYTLDVFNQGPSDATGVEVFDLLPTSVAYVSSSATAGNYSDATGLWVVGNLATDASETLTISVEIIGDGEIINVAEVSAQDQEDVDSAPNNGDPTEDDQAEAPLNADCLNSISGHVCLDIDGNGVADAGETGIPAVEITLTSPDGTKTQIITNADGEYTFDELIPGAYTVSVGLGPDTTVLTSGAQYQLTLECEDVEDINFCFTPVDILGSIGDYVWLDANGDGIQDPNEQGIPNVSVMLTAPDGMMFATVTDADGLYLFDELLEGTYVVTVGNGPDNSALTTTGSYTTELGPGEDFLADDFGFTSSTVDLG